MTRDVSKDKQGDIVTVTPVRATGVKQYSDSNGVLTDSRDNNGVNPKAECRNGSKPDLGEIIKAAENLKTGGAYFSNDDKGRSADGGIERFLGIPPMQHNLIFAKGSPIKALCK